MKKIKYIALISGLIIVSFGCQRNDSSHIPNGEKITEVFTEEIVEDTEESYSDNIYENITEESTYVEPTVSSDILDGTYRRIYRYEYAKNNFYYTFTPDYMGALNGTWISSINNSPDEGGIYTLNEDIVTISVTYNADDGRPKNRPYEMQYKIKDNILLPMDTHYIYVDDGTGRYVSMDGEVSMIFEDDGRGVQTYENQVNDFTYVTEGNRIYVYFSDDDLIYTLLKYEGMYYYHAYEK